MIEATALPDALEIEARANRHGIRVNALCREVGIARSTFSRWKAGTTEPQLRVYRKIVSTLDEMIARQVAQ